ncbi:adenosylmethionine--8-amino-7-oxononanoate transaminase [Paludifilum halophilum]|uniref:Adenosylmethionine-8-amino-7-oxononanoate aminotransferase n=1 Tax=Paludifilum halophilum TaxID=1642702 RepID=A0A235B3M8_9BACL|nr:adenosylmethionine--8-amino-7-oxononanoate transaminase [Paludifilum halophilum]OYD06908.1 adenosylmethionine--8-amino-7-oxononanoate transaminase [Paludifilum halophilum]
MEKETVSKASVYEEWLEKNRRYLWNPFTQMKDYFVHEPVIVERGDGVTLTDVKGRTYYDGNASVWLNVHGHNRRELNEAIIRQLDRIAHSTLLGMANVPAIRLAERLVEITPPGLNKVFYSDSGAEAVEVAIKMAFLYWKRIGRPKKRMFLSMKSAYHGDTVGAVSVGGIDRFHAAYDALLFPTEKVGYPYPYRYPGSPEACAQASLEELRQKLEEKGEQIAGLILEPMIQGAGGMVVMPPGFLKEVERLCREYEVLLLADEVATGFGRTGEMFACDHEQVQPDLLTAAKGITGGYLPVAATLATDAIYEAFYGDYEEMKTFFHGHSYTGNQLGCAAALANLDLFERDGLIQRIRESGEALDRAFEPLRCLEHVGEVRSLGLMAGVELVRNRETREAYPAEERVGFRVCQRAKERGLITRPLGDVITFLPPLCVGKQELSEMVQILHSAIRDVTEK